MSRSIKRRSRDPVPQRPHAARLSVLLLTLVAGCSEAPPPPDVLFVVVDTLRADHLSCYGYERETSPHIDALAERGALFANCTAQSSWTMPSMISLMTGETLWHDLWRIPDEMPLLAERFADAGYRTGAVVANSVLAEEAGFARGHASFQVRQKGRRQWSAHDVNARALDFLAAHDQRPSFLWVHYLDPHFPYDPPRQHRTFQGDPETLFDTAQRALFESVIAARPEAERSLLGFQVPDLARDVDLYDGEVAFVDSAIGRLLTWLDEQGRRENTLVVILSDHGEGLYERVQHPDKHALVLEHKRATQQRVLLSDHLHKEHGYWIHEELVHTPFVIAGPGVTPGRRSAALASNLDAAATVLGLCGLELPDGPGRDLGPWLAAPAGQPVPDAPLVTSWCSEQMTARTPEGRKLMLPGLRQAEQFGHTVQVFDLAQDPRERRPSPPTPADEALISYLREQRDSDVFALWTNAMDEATRERLRELGYLRDG